MTDREKLIELIASTEYGNGLVGENFQEGFIAKIADHLIANDVVQVVRCKDCKAYDKEVGYCEAMGFTCEMDDFCSYGERKDNG